jgi:hypothetical protein
MTPIEYDERGYGVGTELRKAARRLRQIEHIKEHQEKFDKHQLTANADVAQYFLVDYADVDDLYVSLCSDLDIEPREENL